MMIIDGAPDFSTDIQVWKDWLNELRTDPFFVKYADDENVIGAISRAQEQIALLEELDLEEVTRPDWVNDLMEQK
jgi:hypothetical protein